MKKRPLSIKYLILASDIGHRIKVWDQEPELNEQLGDLSGTTYYCKLDYLWWHHHIYAKKVNEEFVIFDEPVDVTDQYMNISYCYQSDRRFRCLTEEEKKVLWWHFL